MNRYSFAEKTFKPAFRFVYYKNQRRKVIRELGLRRRQDKLLKKLYEKETERLIVFLVPGADWGTGKDRISGGVLSIASLYNETQKIADVHDSKLIMTTFPLEHLLLHHTNFKNEINVFRFSQLRGHFPELKELVLHIPELLVAHFDSCTSPEDKRFLRDIPGLHINILNQNIRLMPSREVIDSLRSFTPKITVTTAHKKYCTRALREVYGVPLHFFSTFASPESYVFKTYGEKENLLLLSPDDQQKNLEVIELLKKKMPHLKTKVISGLTYDAYKELIGKAKWSITFGEGLDFYFIEPVFSGSISFAIYNEEFFTPDFKQLGTIYGSYKELLEKIADDMRRLDSPEGFPGYQREQFNLCARYYSFEQYRRNIETFYQGEYTLP
jgi:hypothetical protein